MAFGFHLVQIIYWLSLATWFGGVLFIMTAAPIIFRTVKDANPLLPTVLSVNLEGQHGTLLTGSIVFNLLGALLRVEIACAAGLFIAIVAQWFLIDLASGLVTALLRSALYIGAMGIVVYNWRIVWPRIGKHRQEYIDHADEPDVANAALDRFDAYNRQSVTLLTIELAMLLGMVLFSAGIRGAAGTRIAL